MEALMFSDNSPYRKSFKRVADKRNLEDALLGFLKGRKLPKVKKENFERVKGVVRYAREKGVKVRVIWHEKINGRKSKDAIKALGVEPDKVLKVVVFVSENGKPVIGVVESTRKVNTRKLEVVSGLKGLRLARPREVKEITGYEPGGVPPFALKGEVPVYVDRRVMKHDLVYPSAGSPFAGMEVKPEDLVKLAGAKVADISGGKPIKEK